MLSHSTASSGMDVDESAVLLATPLHKSANSRSQLPGANRDSSLEGIRTVTGTFSIETCTVDGKRCVAVRLRSGFRRLANP